MKRLRKIFRILLKLFGVLAGVLVIAFLFFLWRIRIPAPDVDEQLIPASLHREQIAPDYYRVLNCWLKKNKFGIWEMYLEGAPYQRGIIYGVLAKELIEKQEEVFVKQINEMVPGKVYQQFLKFFVAWFNKDIYKYIPEENLKEIYGISLSFSDKFDYIGPKYYRILNYHAAHDIGHALSDFKMVGCTSFAVNKEFSADSSLLIARNFDFNMGDDFAKEKLLVFVNPDSGYKYASYSWAGFTGVVSGMNEKGITVTINAAKSETPYSTKDPISILAREILQYAKNISEAVAIAKKRETFVSESLLIGSAEDDKAVIIEKSPSKTEIYESQNNYLICANHYQSELFMQDSVNLSWIENSDSKYRYERMNELMQENFPLNYKKASDILRNKEGANGKDIGYGNPKSLNQLVAYHAVLFKPKQRKMWVSTSPYQLGEFICYDLNSAFKVGGLSPVDSLTIGRDSFLLTDHYKKYENYKKAKEKIKKFVTLDIPFSMDEKNIASFIENNPESYITYMALGDYFKKKNEFGKARKYYEQALQHEVASKNEIEVLKKNIEDCNKNI